jgi:hypothetical protein
MGFILNEYDVEYAVALANEGGVELEIEAVTTLANLVRWANENSDGWAYWAKPANASTRLQKLVQDHVLPHRYDYRPDALDEAEYRSSLAPIKAFLTRQGVDHSKVIAPDLEEVAREQVQAELRQAWADSEAAEVRRELEESRIAHLFPSWTVQQVGAYAVRSLAYEDALNALG